MQVEMTAVFRIGEHLARFAEDVRGERAIGKRNGTECRQKARLAPIFPRFERLVLDVGGKTNAKALIQMHSDNRDARPAWEIGSILPQRSVGRVVVFADFKRFDRRVPRDIR